NPNYRPSGAPLLADALPLCAQRVGVLLQHLAQFLARTRNRHHRDLALADVGLDQELGVDRWQDPLAAAAHKDLVWPAGAAGPVATLLEERHGEVDRLLQPGIGDDLALER